MQNKRAVFLETLNGKKSKYMPVWFMRQAGRFLKEYMVIKERYDFLTMCTTPEIAAKITTLPEKLGVDALILFSDILIPLKSLGAELSYKDGMQPKVKLDVENLSYKGLGNLDFLIDTIKMVKEHSKDKALLGFAASPFTLACYIFGGDDFINLRIYMKKYPEKFRKLLSELTKLTIDYLNLQIKAGCDAVQLFDSWAGLINQKDYKEFVLPFVKKISYEVKPTIYFVKNSCHLEEFFKECDFACLSVDWRSSLKRIWELTHKTTQGNLDNAVVLSGLESIKSEVENILNSTSDHPHIFNLGHGVLPQTNPDDLKFIVDLVHEKTS